MCAQLHPSISSSNAVLLSLPQPAVPSAYGGQTAYSLDSNANVQNWIIKQVRPGRYEADAETSYGTSDVPTIFHSAWSDCWAHLLLPNETPVTFHNQSKINKPIRCEVCKIDCNSKSVLEEHKSGKKHKRNMQLQNNCTNTVLSGTSYATSEIQMSGDQGKKLFVAVGKELESKKQELLSGSGGSVDSVMVCTICNIPCNSQVDLISDKGTGPKKMKVAQPVRCEVCNINCNSNDVYIVHLSGKKHLRSLERLSKSDNDGAGCGATATNPVTEPQERPDASKQEEINSHEPGNAEKDMETKKRKRKRVGGAPAVSVKLCALCNVVCNSETVYNSHLAGRKHAAMVKKQAELTTS